MSDAAWGLSFGKFLELSFSKYATGNRVANCGHSLQRDCLRFYGYVTFPLDAVSICMVLAQTMISLLPLSFDRFGSMVAFFQYSPISIFCVRLPPPILEFCRPGEQSWLRKEASEVSKNLKAVHLICLDRSGYDNNMTFLTISLPCISF